MKWIFCLIFLCSSMTVTILIFLFTSCTFKINNQHPGIPQLSTTKKTGLTDTNELYSKDLEEVALGSDDINFPYTKQTTLSIPMQNFDDTSEYQINNYPKEFLHAEHKELFNAAIQKAVNKFNLKTTDFTHGSYRLLKNGIEYILFFKNNLHRVSLFQPLSSMYHMKELSVPVDKKVNIILPLKGKLATFSTFLDNLVKKILPFDENISLTVVYFNDESTKKAETLAQQKLSKFPQFEWMLIPMNESQFSRGKGLSIGARLGIKSPTDLMFACDVDVLVLPEFFARCRANAVYDHQVYFPVVFSLYNPKLVYSLHDKPVPDVLDQMYVNKDNGFWRHFGFGMFCMHRKEYDIVGGIPEIYTWGGEDLLFYEQFGKFPFLKVIRSLDPSIFHIFHEKNCSEVRSNLYPSCLASKASSEGTSVQLGLLFFKLHEGIDVEGILSKRFYYFYWFPLMLGSILLCLITILYQRWMLCKLSIGINSSKEQKHQKNVF